MQLIADFHVLRISNFYTVTISWSPIEKARAELSKLKTVKTWLFIDLDRLNSRTKLTNTVNIKAKDSGMKEVIVLLQISCVIPCFWLADDTVPSQIAKFMVNQYQLGFKYGI